MRLKCSCITAFMIGTWLLNLPELAGYAFASDETENANDSTETAREQMTSRIDLLLAQKWEAENVEPAPPTSDSEFLRRVCLDLNGVIPRVWEVRAFLSDDRLSNDRHTGDRPDKRRLLIERLLASPRYASHMASVWRNRILPHEIELERFREVLGLQKWLRDRFARNLRYDNLVSGLLLTTGGDELGPGLYFRAHDLVPEKLAASTAELFLGLHLQCAQCHDHPSADWSQRDFWGFAAFFARVRSPTSRTMQVSYRLVDANSGEVRLPDSDETVAPKYLQAELASIDSMPTRRMQLALWMTSRDNQFFAHAAVNWAWSHLFGRGLVESLDPIEQNDTSGHSQELEAHKLEASSLETQLLEAQLLEAELLEAQLLKELADYFVDTGFDLQNLLRTLANTRAYQLSGRHEDPRGCPPQLFARMLAKPLTPEQLYDSFLVLSPSQRNAAQQNGPQVEQVSGGLAVDLVRMEFVRKMHSPPGDVTEYRAGTLQTLMLMNGQTMDNLTASSRSSMLGALVGPTMDEEDQVEAIFLATLSRHPDLEEQESCVEILRTCETAKERSDALGDILWALVNSSEFGFNR